MCGPGMDAGLDKLAAQRILGPTGKFKYMR